MDSFGPQSLPLANLNLELCSLHLVCRFVASSGFAVITTIIIGYSLSFLFKVSCSLKESDSWFMVKKEKGPTGVEPIKPSMEQESTDSIPYVIESGRFPAGGGEKNSFNIT